MRTVCSCSFGSLVFVLDDGKEKREIFLNHPNKALHIKPAIWSEMIDFSSESVCLALASIEYVEENYLRDYGQFIYFRNLSNEI